MTDKNTAGHDSEDNKAKLPPRSSDWHSGLKRKDSAEQKATAPDTVSDFLASQRSGESSGWDEVSEPQKREYVGVFSSSEPAEGPPDYPPPASRETLDFYRRRTRFTDLIIALLLSALAFLAVATTYRGYGHSWDEALYLKPAERAAAWMVGVINLGDDLMLQRDTVDSHWGQYLDGYDPLHPEVAPVPKLLIGAGLTYLQPMFNLDPMVAMRLPHAILFALTVGLLFLLGTREYGRIGGFAAALFYLLMPRVFGHAHIAASETPLTFFVVLTVYCFLVANRFWPFALFTGVAFGLAAATKVSALMLPVPLMIWGQLYKRRDYASNVFAMAFIAPVVMVAVWPWLWYDGIKRFYAYLMFYLNHQPTALFYMGRHWGYTHGRVAPFYYPLHIAALVVPVWFLFFLLIGLLRALFSTIRRPATILFLMMAIAWIGLSMLPQAPKYDGERLFFPAFAFLALLAAGGFSAFFVGIHNWRARRHGEVAVRETGYIGAIALVLILAYGAADLYFTHPNNLNFYNWLVGRAKGAYDKGFETSYWGEAVNEDVTSFLNQTLKPGDKVKTMALNELAFENLRRWGKLPEKVDFSPDEPPYDYVIMQVRQGFMLTQERRIFRGQADAALRTFEANGVPRIVVYDGSKLSDMFPIVKSQETFTTGTIFDIPPDNESPAVDQPTTATEAVTTGAAETAAITDVDELMPQSAIGTTESLQTSPSAVLDLSTSAPADSDSGTTVPEAPVSLQQHSVDDQTTTPEDLAVEQPAAPAVQPQPADPSPMQAPPEKLDDVTTGMVLESLVEPEAAETSAPMIYEGDLPSTAPVEQIEENEG